MQLAIPPMRLRLKKVYHIFAKNVTFIFLPLSPARTRSGIRCGKPLRMLLRHVYEVASKSITFSQKMSSS